MNFNCEGFWNCVTPDAWFTGFGTLVGAFLGAFLAGIFTRLSIKQQITHDNLQRKKTEITNHLRFSVDFIARIDTVVTEGDKLNEMISYDDTRGETGRFTEETIKYAENYYKLFNVISKELERLNYYVTPYEFYRRYIVITEMVNILKSYILPLIEDLKRPIKTDYIHFSGNYGQFNKYLLEIKSYLSELKLLISNEEGKFNEINKKLEK